MHTPRQPGSRQRGPPADWRKRATRVDLPSQLEFLTTPHSDAFKHQCVARIEAFLRRYGE